MLMFEFYSHYNYYFLFGGVFISYLVYRIFQTFLSNANFMRMKYKLKGHAWRNIECNKSIPYSIDCNVCNKLMLPSIGLFCECCGASACKKCRSIVDGKNRCKEISWNSDKPFFHLWVNVGVVTRRIEEGQIEDSSVLTKYFCAWCQRTRVSADSVINNEICDFLKYKNIIIPPSCVQIEKEKVSLIKELPDNDWEPLIVFANRKSGSYKGDEVLSIFRGVLNPIQVIDIASVSPESAVKWMPSRCRVLVAGGDGTVAWVLNALHGTPRVKASVGIIPMGTGNDLSRSLGWGPGNADLDAHSIINYLKNAQETPLDRWKITVKARRRRLGRLGADRVLYAYNYASVGVDAQVALDFHRARAQFLYRYANRTINYMAYLLLGVGRVLDAGACGDLERRMRVWARGAGELTLPPLQALVLLNIPCWGAGVNLWKLGSDDVVGDQFIDDGKLEVVGISSSFHIARLQCGLAEPFRFAQSSHIKIELDGTCAMQVDGEPWMQGPATITVEPAGQSSMLRATGLN